MSLYLRNATWIDPETFKATTTDDQSRRRPVRRMALDATRLWSVRRKTPYWIARAVSSCLLRLRAPPYLLGPRARYAPAPKTPTNFLEVLEYVWWRMDKKLDHDMIEPAPSLPVYTVPRTA